MEKRYIEKRYHNLRNRGSFAGLKKFKNEQQLKHFIAQEALSSLPAYTLHKTALNRFQRRRVVSHFAKQIFCTDLIDLQKFYKFNGGKKWLCLVMDLYSRYLYGFPLANKKAATVKKGFQELFKRIKYFPLKIWSDEGGEYLGKVFQDYLKSVNIGHYSTNSKLKCSVCERVNQTILRKLHRYFTFAKTKKWIDVIQRIIDTYNNEKHSSLGMSPSQAFKKENHSKVQFAAEQRIPKNKRAVFRVGDRVLLGKNKMLFAKSYAGQFGEDVYKVHSIKYSNPVTYIVSDLDGNIIPGSFYKEQIQKVT